MNGQLAYKQDWARACCSSPGLVQVPDSESAISTHAYVSPEQHGGHLYMRPASTGCNPRLVREQCPMGFGQVGQFASSSAITLSSSVATHITAVRCDFSSSLGAWQAAAIESEQLGTKCMNPSPVNLQFMLKGKNDMTSCGMLAIRAVATGLRMLQFEIK
jgi:hypothetical protein